MASAVGGLTAVGTYSLETSHDEPVSRGCPRQNRFRIPQRRHGKDLNLTSYLHNRYWKTYQNIDLNRLARNHPPFLQRLDHLKTLPVHNGCVNTICWNKTGEYILSGSDDCNLCITKPGSTFDKTSDYSVIHKVQTRHLGNIFHAQFIPNTGDKQTVSCSSEGPIIVHDINSVDPSDGLLSFNCHSETIFAVVPVPDDDKIFLSCGEDKTIRLFDMRVHNSCARAGTCPHPALIRNSHAVTTLTLHPLNSNLMLVGRADGVGLVYDRRKLPDVTKFTRERIHEARSAGENYPSYQFKHPLEGVVTQFVVPHMEERCRFTSLCYNKNGSEILASYSGDYIYLFNHDASSNIELVRTLPKKENKLSADGESNGDDSGVSSGSNQRRAPAPRDPRISRIRVRGDWSDTGVNSVPLSQRRHNGENAHRPSLLERMAASLSSRPRFVPITEIIAGPIEHNINSNRSNEPDIEEGEVETDDEPESSNSERSTLIGEDEEMEDSDDMDDNEHYASFIVQSLVGQATEEASSMITQSNEESMNEESEVDNRADTGASSGNHGERNNSQRCDGERSSGSSKSCVSPQTKAKFRKMVDDLKARLNIATYHPRVMYQGHRNSRTSFKEAIFWGDDFIMSGSDCGRIMVWEKESAKIVMGFKADERVVNCLAPNPTDYVLASSGIDYDIKLWSTQGLEEAPLKVSDEEMQKIVNNNELMLEESKHTLSVPPHLFFRVLASLVQSSR